MQPELKSQLKNQWFIKVKTIYWENFFLKYTIQNLLKHFRSKYLISRNVSGLKKHTVLKDHMCAIKGLVAVEM